MTKHETLAQCRACEKCCLIPDCLHLKIECPHCFEYQKMDKVRTAADYEYHH